jgi:fluoride ion exporter CrcB/FEX
VIAALFVMTAAAGTLLRWAASLSVPARAIATFGVNVGGAFGLGLLSTASADSQLIGGVAGLGALTTFSTFVAETIELDEVSRSLATRYVAATFVVGVGAAWVGLQLA